MNPGKSVTVLLIEDDPAFAELLRVIFARQHCQAIIAPTVNQALSAVSAPNAPELVVLDLVLPGSDAEDTISKIAELRAHANNAIILVLSGVPGLQSLRSKIPPDIPLLEKRDRSVFEKIAAIARTFSSGLVKTEDRLREIERLATPAPP